MTQTETLRTVKLMIDETVDGDVTTGSFFFDLRNGNFGSVKFILDSGSVAFTRLEGRLHSNMDFIVLRNVNSGDGTFVGEPLLPEMRVVVDTGVAAVQKVWVME